MNINFDELRNTIRSILKESTKYPDTVMVPEVPPGSELTGFEREIDPATLSPITQTTSISRAVSEQKDDVDSFVGELSKRLEKKYNYEVEVIEGLNEAIMELLKDYIILSEPLSSEEVKDMSEEV